MLTVGLTGGYATGKSFVASVLEVRGCFVVYADKLGHAVLEIEGEAYWPTVERFGRDILRPDGSIDRKKLGAIVFTDPERLAELNSLVHPTVQRMEDNLLEQYRADHASGIAVVEAAILLETGRYKDFDRLIVTTCDQELQITRGMKRDNLTREEVWARLARQMQVSEKGKYADYVIDTSGPKQSTVLEVEAVFLRLKEQAEGGTA